MNAEQTGALVFEVSEFERGQNEFVCTALRIFEDHLVVLVGEHEFTLNAGDDRDDLYNQLHELGVTVLAPHRGEIPDIELSDAHVEWVELLRDLSYGPEDLVRIGYGTLLCASTDREAGHIVIEHGGQSYPFRFEFDGTYPAGVVADCMAEIAI